MPDREDRRQQAEHRHDRHEDERQSGRASRAVPTGSSAATTASTMRAARRARRFGTSLTASAKPSERGDAQRDDHPRRLLSDVDVQYGLRARERAHERKPDEGRDQRVESGAEFDGLREGRREHGAGQRDARAEHEQADDVREQVAVHDEHAHAAKHDVRADVLQRRRPRATGARDGASRRGRTPTTTNRRTRRRERRAQVAGLGIGSHEERGCRTARRRPSATPTTTNSTSESGETSAAGATKTLTVTASTP